MEKTVFNYDKLKGKIREVFKTQSAFANWLGISEGSLYEKFNSDSYFNQEQISKLIGYFNMSPEDVYDYFFTKQVEQNSIGKVSEDLIEEEET